MELKRTTEEMQKLLDALKEELATLPETNAFGDSNKESRRETKEWIGDLEASIAIGQNAAEDDTGEMCYWLAGKSDMLDIYLE